ncbi:MAG TPA: universal stress protein [Vicinamibacterales bacterium]|nr:universal stress protein [Vicinamibacterales bacterium]
MFRRILVPTDLTDRTVKALDVAGRIAESDEAHVTVLHVIETIAGAEFEEFSSFYQNLEELARKQLDEIVARAPSARGRVDVAIVYGRRAEEVLRFARSHDIDLIVLASHPVDPSRPYGGMGTMSYKLGILAPSAVLLVK